ncbi:MAG TPA: hypothetical protein VK588_15050 [Chitinophagaceae bacterium]|nr:hypothetical protein [Chitinophagaceae bacterium]
MGKNQFIKLLLAIIIFITPLNKLYAQENKVSFKENTSLNQKSFTYLSSVLAYDKAKQDKDKTASNPAIEKYVKNSLSSKKIVFFGIDLSLNEKLTKSKAEKINSQLQKLGYKKSKSIASDCDYYCCRNTSGFACNPEHSVCGDDCQCCDL